MNNNYLKISILIYIFISSCDSKIENRTENESTIFAKKSKF
jgi:hypothetical protein